MLRKLIISIIALGFSCATTTAQEEPNAIVVQLENGTSQTFSIAQIDSICFPEQMVIYMHSGTVNRFNQEEITDIDFATVDASELYEAIDLGLSVRWAAYNIGATKQEEYGGLYAWGETSTKSDYSESKYKYFSQEQYQFIGTNICGTRYDVARQQWGGSWRLPTRNEIKELTSQCTWTAEQLNGINGYRVTGPNGNSIFLPAAGYQPGKQRQETGSAGFYWSGTLNREMTSSAYNLNFRGYDAEWTASRAYGFSVRPVR